MKKNNPPKRIGNEKYAQYRDNSHNEKEKPENMMKTARKLLALLKGKGLLVIITAIFAAVGSILTVLGPRYLGDIINVLDEQIKAKLETLRAGLQADGGDLELVKIDGKVVYLKLVGHCGSCPFAMMTLKQGIEAGLQEIDPEITVERVEE